jgi:Mor family transcriptional regulator
MTQSPMFDDLPVPTDLDAIQVDEPSARWPQSLADMVDVAAQALAAEGDRAQGLARQVLYALAKYHGGRQFYLPTGDALDRAIRDTRLWQEYTGRPEDIARFVRETGLTEQAVYRILAEQRRLHRDRTQAKLF